MISAGICPRGKCTSARHRRQSAFALIGQRCLDSCTEKSIADLLSAAKAMRISPMELSERIIDGDKLPEGIKSGLKKNLASFVGVIRKLRRAAAKVSLSYVTQIKLTFA